MKKPFLIVLFIAIGTLAFAQVGIGVYATATLSDVNEDPETALLDPYWISASVEWKILPFLGIGGQMWYNRMDNEIDCYNYGIKAYLPLYFMQPSIGFDFRRFPQYPEFGDAIGLKTGMDIGNLRRFTISADLAYYGWELTDMIEDLRSDALTALYDFTELNIGAKLWL